MSADEYPSHNNNFSQTETVFTILSILFVTSGVLKIGKYHSDILQINLAHIKTSDASGPIGRERKY